MSPPSQPLVREPSSAVSRHSDPSSQSRQYPHHSSAGPLPPTPFKPLAQPKTSAWQRLRPPKSQTDILETYGFVSKGDTRLLDHATQDKYFDAIVDRYMRFCKSHGRALSEAFRALAVNSDLNLSGGFKKGMIDALTDSVPVKRGVTLEAAAAHSGRTDTERTVPKETPGKLIPGRKEGVERRPDGVLEGWQETPGKLITGNAKVRGGREQGIYLPPRKRNGVVAIPRGLEGSRWADEGMTEKASAICVANNSSTHPLIQPSRALDTARPVLNTAASDTTSQIKTETAAADLSTLLLSLRKLREALLSTTFPVDSSHPTASLQSPPASHSRISFAQRVYLFTIRLSILARVPESYHSSLRYLLFTLNTSSQPLSLSDRIEITSYSILDLTLRQDNILEAYAIRRSARETFGFRNRDVDDILRCVIRDDFVTFWRIRDRVDGYIRSLMGWKENEVRRRALKVLGKAYLSVDLRWVLRVAGCVGDGGDEDDSNGGRMAADVKRWDELVKVENIGWQRNGAVVVVRKPKAKGAS